MTQSRPDIPEPLKRQIRQKCGFGCVICGIPVYHYDHLDDYSKVKSHELENLVLLCPNHHQDKTSHRLPQALLNSAASNPRNLSHSRSSPYRFFMTGDQTNLWVGGNLFSFRFSDIASDIFTAIEISGKSVMSIQHEDGSLLLNLVLSDLSGKEVLRIERGELVISTGVWDYRIEGRLVEIRSETAKIDVVFSFLDDGIRIDRGLFLLGGKGIVVNAENYVMFPNGPSFIGNKISQCRVAVSIN